jgi:HAMP domain-containing protein
MYAAGQASEAYTAATRSAALTSLLWAFALIGLALVIALGVALMIVRRVTRPLREMANVVNRLASGETGVSVPGAGRGDEVGAIARSIEVFRVNLIETEKLKAEQESLKTSNDAARRREIREMADRFDASVGRIVQEVASALHCAARGRAGDDGQLRCDLAAIGRGGFSRDARDAKRADCSSSD